VDLIERLSRLGVDVPAVAELDLNPVLGLPDGCVAVDARVRIAHPEINVPTKSW
jgi:acetyltransferase